jgi:hypothetical protein
MSEVSSLVHFQQLSSIQAAAGHAASYYSSSTVSPSHENNLVHVIQQLVNQATA